MSCTTYIPRFPFCRCLTNEKESKKAQILKFYIFGR